MQQTRSVTVNQLQRSIMIVVRNKIIANVRTMPYDSAAAMTKVSKKILRIFVQ